MSDECIVISQKSNGVVFNDEEVIEFGDEEDETQQRLGLAKLFNRIMDEMGLDFEIVVKRHGE